MSNAKWVKIIIGATTGLSIQGLVKAGRKEKLTLGGAPGSAFIGDIAPPLAEPALGELAAHIRSLPPRTQALVRPPMARCSPRPSENSLPGW